MSRDEPQDEEAYERVRGFLVDHGLSDRQVARARRDDVLHLLVADAMVLPTPGRYTPEDVVERTGLDRTSLERLWRAMGFPAVAEDERAFSDVDLEAVQAAASFVGPGQADLEEIVQLTRVVGSSMARVADAEVAAMPGLRADGDSLASADQLVASEGQALGTTARLLEYVWRRHMQAALRRAAVVRPGDLAGESLHDAGVQELTVGFADLVGFTAQAQQLSEAALSELVSRFEALAHDTVVSSGGRVVKMIGDEVMFVLSDPGDGVQLGLALAEAYAGDELLSDVRVGLAAGPVLAKDGDFYGPTVNLAHRIVNVARPGSVVTSASVHERLAEDHRFDWRTIRGRYLKDIGRVNLHTARRRDPDAEGITERARRVGEQHMRSLLPDPVRQRFEDRVRDGDGG
jgi:adenylate cyclase